MTCSNKPNYTPFKLQGLAPTKQWGLGRSASYERFNPSEFHALEDEVKITFPVDFRGKVKGSNTPNPSRGFSHASQIYRENVLRGSQFLSKPSLLFNGAVYNEKTVYNGAMVASTQEVNQGLMFYWEDFINPDPRIKEGDMVTFSVDVRSTGEDIPTGAVAFKGTSNFEEYYKVLEQPITKEFTRVSFTTRFLSKDWEWDEAFGMFWGVENVPVTDYPMFQYDKDKLVGFIQAQESVQLEFSRPMVSTIGKTAYIESGDDMFSNNKWDWSKAVSKGRLNEFDGKYNTNGIKQDWAMPEFIPIFKGSERIHFYKKTTLTETTDAGHGYGKILFYSAANEDSYMNVYKKFPHEAGVYGGYAAEVEVPIGATHYRVHITSERGKATTEAYVQSSANDWSEFSQEWYDGLSGKLDGKTARAETFYRKEMVEMEFELHFAEAVQKALPDIFKGLTTDAEKQQRLRDIAYQFDSTMIARGRGQGNNLADWIFYRWAPDGSIEEQTMKQFRGEGLTSVTHPSSYQEWINPQGRIVTSLRSNRIIPNSMYMGTDTLSGKYDPKLTTLQLEVNGELVDKKATLDKTSEVFTFTGLKGFLKPEDKVRIAGWINRNNQWSITYSNVLMGNTPENVAEFNERAFVEADYLVTNMSIIVTQSQMDEWGFNPNLPDYRIESLERPASRTEEYMINSMVQVTHAYDIYGFVESNYPEFFGDCYTFDDRIRKINERIKQFNLVATTYSEEPWEAGNPTIFISAEANNPDRDYDVKAEINQTVELQINNSKGHFIHPNGYIYVGFARMPRSDRETGISVDSELSFEFTMDRQYDSLPRVFRYNYQKQPWFLFVRNINRSVLAPKVNTLTPINGGTRRYNFGATEDARYISMDCFIKAPAEEDMPKLMEELADFLDVGETVIQFSDNKDRYYKVMLDGSTDLSQTLHVGTLTLTFVLLENTAIGEEVVESFDIDSTTGSVPFIELENMGTADAYPTYQLTFEEPVGYVDLIGTDTSANVSIGRRPKDNEDEVKVDLRPRKFYSKFTSTDGAGWTAMNDTHLPQIEGYQTKLQGTVQRVNGMANQDKWNYGDTSHRGWHGAGIIANLQKNLDDFYMEASIVATGKPVKTSANAIFLIFYDENNNPYAYTKVGTRPQEGNLDSYVAYAGDWGKRKVVNNGAKWKDFWGKVSVQRRDNRWRLIVGQYKDRRYSPSPEASFNFGQNMLKDTRDTGWFDLPPETWGKKFARVGIFFGQYSHRPNLGHLSVRRLVVWENLEEYGEKPLEGTPILFHEGDTVVIDSSKAQAYLNGELTPSLVDPMTDWFPITKGDNYIGINNFKGKLDIVYNERFK